MNPYFCSNPPDGFPFPPITGVHAFHLAIPAPLAGQFTSLFDMIRIKDMLVTVNCLEFVST